MTTKKDGHGYGLVTCSKIIKNHNATITITSEVGQGTEFVIDFALGNDPDGTDH